MCQTKTWICVNNNAKTFTIIGIQTLNTQISQNIVNQLDRFVATTTEIKPLLKLNYFNSGW